MTTPDDMRLHDPQPPAPQPPQPAPPQPEPPLQEPPLPGIDHPPPMPINPQATRIA